MESFTCWWKESVIYQIYPRSFKDGNGDGIGDIPGIIDSIPYLSWLGVGAIWLSPIYRSPMYDFGYDISDYRKIDPIFGSIDDVDRLVKVAHEHGIALLFDMVLNHTSIEHPWFKESSSSLDNPKRNFYIWREHIGTWYPNNWYAAFGGRAWSLDASGGYYYLHSFLKEQPDLNWRDEQMVQSLFSDMAFWFDKGIDGFRLDVINLIMKDESLRNNPIGWGGRPRPYDLQRHLYDRNQVESHHALKKFRSWVDTYDEKMLVGEILVEKPGEPEMAASYLGNGTDELHLAFDFTFTWLPWSAKKWQRAALRWYRAVPQDGWPCWVLSNHDVKRAFSRYGEHEGRAMVAACFLLTQRGTPFIYYGEEKGLPDRSVAKSEIQDPLGIRYWPFHKGRDGARRPMIWDTTYQWGFSPTKAWLPPYERTVRPNENLLHGYRNLIRLRNTDAILRIGAICWIELTHTRSVLAYVRYGEVGFRLILLNFSKRTVACRSADLKRYVPNGEFSILFSEPNYESGHLDMSNKTIQLKPYQAIIASADTIFHGTPRQ
jgi:alpha-glucosidase